MRKAWIINPLLTVMESDESDHIWIEAANSTILLTREEWKDLMSLNYTAEIKRPPVAQADNG